MARDDARSIGDRMAESWLDTLGVNAAFDRPWVEAAVEWLLVAAPARVVVDVGCGAGGAAHAFAARLPAGSRVVAVDRDHRLLELARRRAREQQVDGRIRWTTGQIGALPVPVRSADLVWASGVVHHVGDQQAAVAELAALVTPGGRLALVEGGLPLRCLPHEIGIGRPGLEARLDEARARWFEDMRAELPGTPMPYGWPEALARAGLTGVRARSFLAEATPPLDDVGRRIVEQHLTAARDELGDRLDADDRATLDRLLDADDPAWVGRRTDLVVTAVRTVHVGTVSAT
ncbi:MAG TPA: class I SAM-dependent methyltransferase [Acidimicrobiales bacterium]